VHGARLLTVQLKLTSHVAPPRFLILDIARRDVE
jgi:hypothetical protein